MEVDPGLTSAGDRLEFLRESLARSTDLAQSQYEQCINLFSMPASNIYSANRKESNEQNNR